MEYFVNISAKQTLKNEKEQMESLKKEKKNWNIVCDYKEKSEKGEKRMEYCVYLPVKRSLKRKRKRWNIVYNCKEKSEKGEKKMEYCV